MSSNEPFPLSDRNCPPPVRNCPPTVRNFPPSVRNFPPPPRNFPPPSRNFPPPPRNFPPPPRNFPPPHRSFANRGPPFYPPHPYPHPSVNSEFWPGSWAPYEPNVPPSNNQWPPQSIPPPFPSYEMPVNPNFGPEQWLGRAPFFFPQSPGHSFNGPPFPLSPPVYPLNPVHSQHAAVQGPWSYNQLGGGEENSNVVPDSYQEVSYFTAANANGSEQPIRTEDVPNVLLESKVTRKRDHEETERHRPTLKRSSSIERRLKMKERPRSSDRSPRKRSWSRNSNERSSRDTKRSNSHERIRHRQRNCRVYSPRRSGFDLNDEFKRESTARGSSKYHRFSRSNSPETMHHMSLECKSAYEESKDVEEELEEEISMWLRCSPSDLYYSRCSTNPLTMVATPKLVALLDRFEEEIVLRANKVRMARPQYEHPTRKQKMSLVLQESSDSDSVELSDGESSGDEDTAMQELERKRKHPDRLNEELWYNDLGEMNDGPLCRCSNKARRSGIRHGIYPGEDHLLQCDPLSNNADRLFHYRITMSPHTNFLTKTPTIIRHDGHEFLFEGFSMLSHYKLSKLPTCKVIRFNIEYTIHYMEEKLPDNFTIRGLELFCDYLYREILELVDLDLRAHEDDVGCKRFHFFPRFARPLDDNGKEILSMNEVLSYMLTSSRPLVEEGDLTRLTQMNQYEWQNFADEVKGMIVTYPGMKPCSLRVDQLDRDLTSPVSLVYPEIVHFGIRPLQLSYAGNPNYQKAWREYVKFRHLLANKPKVSYQDRHKLMQKEMRLQEMRTKSNLKRDITVVVSSKGFFRTGIMCDIVQHAMLLPVLVCHLRFHKALHILEENIGHSFEDRYLLQLALTHPSYRENFGTNPDHARNSLTNCGIRQPEYGDRRIHYMNTRKRGINTLINIMSRFGKHEETVSNINHNERLEFLGDAVVEFLTSIHLFHLFPDIEEGGLATYRAAIVQNQHLAVLAKKLQLEKFMLYAHGSDLCHDLELRHAMANCFEALMGMVVTTYEVFNGLDQSDKWLLRYHISGTIYLIELTKTCLRELLTAITDQLIGCQAETVEAYARRARLVEADLLTAGRLPARTQVVPLDRVNVRSSGSTAISGSSARASTSNQPGAKAAAPSKSDKAVAKTGGALFLDGGVHAADRVFSQTLFSDMELLDVWVNYPPHPIQEQEPDGDRQWIDSVPLLTKMTKFEDEIGVEFKHIRLLARAFTHRSVGYNNLTLGSNQRMEFLGDTVLQLVASEYLYKFFPEHHEGHLSLLRSSLVNNRTQSVVCDDLGMVDYAIYAYPKGELKIKDRADLLEGALYVDKGLEYCQVFCQVCFFPRLQDFIMNQDWNDPKSKLQQCCLTLRTMDGGEPDIPIYKVIECKGPTNTRIFTVAVYFRGERLAKGSGHSIQQAEMAAASRALESSKADLFPQLNHQRRVIERSLKQQRQRQREDESNRSASFSLTKDMHQDRSGTL